MWEGPKARDAGCPAGHRVSETPPFDRLLQQRLEKVNELRRRGIDPYPIRTRRTHLAAQVLAEFDSTPEQTVCVAGRLVGGKRVKGGQSFVHLLDDSGRIQVSLRRDLLGEAAYRL